MQRFCLAALLCIAFVAYAAAADSKQPSSSDVASLSSTDVKKILAMDSPVATYVFDKDAFVAAAPDGSNRYGYTHRRSSKKHHKKASHKHDDYKKEEKKEYKEEKKEEKKEYKEEKKEEKKEYKEEKEYKPSSPKYEHHHKNGHHKNSYDGYKNGYKNGPDGYYKNGYKNGPEGYYNNGYKNGPEGYYNNGYKNGPEGYYNEGPEEYDDGYYGHGVKLCLIETERDPNIFPNPKAAADTEFKFQSFFTCCDRLEHKDSYLKYSEVPDATTVHDVIEAMTPVGYCNWTAVAGTTGRSKPFPDSVVGYPQASCEIIEDAECLAPLRKGFTFSTDPAYNMSYWLESPAGLSSKSYGFGVYAAGDKSKASVSSAQPAAIKPAYSPDGEYEYEPSSDPIDADGGKVEQFTNMIASTEAIKGGSLTFIAGFIKPDGTVKCPVNITEKYGTFEEPKGLAPVVKCGQYTLHLDLPHGGGGYYGYDGFYHSGYYKEGYGPEGEYYHGPGEYYKEGYTGPTGEYKEGYYGPKDGYYKEGYAPKEGYYKEGYAPKDGYYKEGYAPKDGYYKDREYYKDGYHKDGEYYKDVSKYGYAPKDGYYYKEGYGPKDSYYKADYAGPKDGYYYKDGSYYKEGYGPKDSYYKADYTGPKDGYYYKDGSYYKEGYAPKDGYYNGPKDGYYNGPKDGYYNGPKDGYYNGPKEGYYGPKDGYYITDSPPPYYPSHGPPTPPPGPPGPPRVAQPAKAPAKAGK